MCRQAGQVAPSYIHHETDSSSKTEVRPMCQPEIQPPCSVSSLLNDLLPGNQHPGLSLSLVMRWQRCRLTIELRLCLLWNPLVHRSSWPVLSCYINSTIQTPGTIWHPPLCLCSIHTAVHMQLAVLPAADNAEVWGTSVCHWPTLFLKIPV